MNANAVPRSGAEREALFREFLAWDAKRQQGREVRQRKRAQ
jgi:hypothetical protein